MIITAEPYDRMSLPALRAELAMWDRHLEIPQNFGASRALAQDCRDVCAAWVARREREATGRAA